MPLGISAFQPERLTEARDAREITAVTLSELVGVSPATISQYENGHQKPRQDTLDRLARVLNIPTEFFLRPALVERPTTLFYRSMSSATKSARSRAEARYKWFLEAQDYLLQFFDFPDVNLPALDVSPDFRRVTKEQIEKWAEQLRESWQLGSAPIANLTQTLETQGILVWRTLINAETLDAFSEFREPHPVIVLSSEKENYFRSRTDAAHELGHLVMHRAVERKALTKAADFKLLEEQANYFAATFLLPAEAFQRELWGVSLDTFRSLKPRWNVSMGLQIMRCRHLGLLSDEQEKRLWINRSRRGWHRREPLDDSTPPERPSLMAKSFKMLIDAKVRSREQILKDLSISSTDVENIGGLPEGYFSGAAEGDPTFKLPVNVVPFRR
jgi:Zn-dependent peptidase ImmA (M78 family)/DNA-binding XRE family transcriptional regulator